MYHKRPRKVKYLCKMFVSSVSFTSWLYLEKGKGKITIFTFFSFFPNGPCPICITTVNCCSISVPVPVWPSVPSLLCFPAFPFVTTSFRAHLHIFTIYFLSRRFCTSRFDATEPTSLGPFWNTFAFVLIPRYTF